MAATLAVESTLRYLWRGSSRNLVPEYLIRLNNGKALVLEVKSIDSEQNRTKRVAMQTWVQAAEVALGHAAVG